MDQHIFQFFFIGKRAIDAGHGCKIYIRRTHMKTLEIIPMETLKKFAVDIS